MLNIVALHTPQAFAEMLHETVRKDYWGYGKEEDLSNDDLLQIKYQVCSDTSLQN